MNIARLPAALPALALLIVATALAATPAAAQQQGQLYEGYLAELNEPSPSYVAVSNHFRHEEAGAACTIDGCILMGPMDDREACDRWVAAYNQIDPFDHARCVEQIEGG